MLMLLLKSILLIHEILLTRVRVRIIVRLPWLRWRLRQILLLLRVERINTAFISSILLVMHKVLWRSRRLMKDLLLQLMLLSRRCIRDTPRTALMRVVMTTTSASVVLVSWTSSPRRISLITVSSLIALRSTGLRWRCWVWGFACCHHVEVNKREV